MRRRAQDTAIREGVPLDHGIHGALINGPQLRLSLENENWEGVAALEAVVDDTHRSPHEKAVLGFFRVLDEIQNPDGGWYGWLPSPTVIARAAENADGAKDALEKQNVIAGVLVVDKRRMNTKWGMSLDVELRNEVTAECEMKDSSILEDENLDGAVVRVAASSNARRPSPHAAACDPPACWCSTRPAGSRSSCATQRSWSRRQPTRTTR